MVTEFGVVKRTAIEEYRNIRRSGLNAINLDEGDRLISVTVTTGKQDIFDWHENLAWRFVATTRRSSHETCGSRRARH